MIGLGVRVLMRLLFRLTKGLLAVIALLALAITVFVNVAPTFGGSPDAESLAKIAQSKHHNGEHFVNLIPTAVSTRGVNSPSVGETISSLLLPAADKNPTQPLPSIMLDKRRMTDDSFTWLGHSTVLFKTAGKTILTDPVFHRASPIPVGGAPFAMQNPIQMADLPSIDAVIISHDHYDHLDHLAIQGLNDKVGHFYVPLGIKAHLQRWGISDDKITELDWYESAQLGEVALILTPSRHFSGRGLFNRFSTLWSSWVVKSPTLSVYFSGDGGYSPTFAEIGEQFGPFDMAFMEDGAYNDDWAEIHMTPEQSAQAAVDLRAKVLLPIHWGKFDLSRHEWRDPIERISVAARAQNITLATPLIGETFTLNKLPQSVWWQSLR